MPGSEGSFLVAEVIYDGPDIFCIKTCVPPGSQCHHFNLDPHALMKWVTSAEHSVKHFIFGGGGSGVLREIMWFHCVQCGIAMKFLTSLKFGSFSEFELNSAFEV